MAKRVGQETYQIASQQQSSNIITKTALPSKNITAPLSKGLTPVSALTTANEGNIARSNSNSSSLMKALPVDDKAQLQVYAIKFMSIVDESSKAFKEEGDLGAELQANPGLINDISWLDRIKEQRTIIQENYEELQTLKAPSEFVSAQDDYSLALKYGLKGLNETINGIEQKHPSLVIQSSTDMKTSDAEIKATLAEIQKLK